MTKYDLLVRGGTIVAQNGEGASSEAANRRGASLSSRNQIGLGDIGIRGGKVVAIGDLRAADAGEVFDATGLVVLPGVIDSHVHFREPGGADDQENFASGTKAAALGGVTTVFDMPNTNPPTIDEAALGDKVAAARGRAWCDFGFYIGATRENTEQLSQLERLPGCCGVKMFVGSSTGSLLVEDDPSMEKVLRSGTSVVAVHAEDEPRLRDRMSMHRIAGDVTSHSRWRDPEAAALAISRIARLVRATGRHVHVLHVSSDAELEQLAAAKADCPITFEVTPHHLLLRAPQAYHAHGTYAQINPPLRETSQALNIWNAVAGSQADTMGSDHAPHPHSLKQLEYPSSPSGFPGTQTMLPLLLTCVNEQRLTLMRLVELLCGGPARVYGIHGKGQIRVGNDADLAVVDMNARGQIRHRDMASLCGWTTYDGHPTQGRVVATAVRGVFTMREGEHLAAAGQPVEFNRSY